MKVFDRYKLRNIRKLKGYSMEMTARMLELRSGRKITRSAICHWERGAARPSIESLLALSELFDVPLDYFFTRRSNCLFEDGEPRRGREA
ncbi:MAG TPA: helix-turn-helix transcriptional regulator [bacterium]|nr:helix-turn-helix transcriptional regulator [bacterium]